MHQVVELEREVVRALGIHHHQRMAADMACFERAAHLLQVIQGARWLQPVLRQDILAINQILGVLQSRDGEDVPVDAHRVPEALRNLIETVLRPVFTHQVIERGQPAFGSPLHQQVVGDMNQLVTRGCSGGETDGCLTHQLLVRQHLVADLQARRDGAFRHLLAKKGHARARVTDDVDPAVLGRLAHITLGVARLFVMTTRGQRAA